MLPHSSSTYTLYGLLGLCIPCILPERYFFRFNLHSCKFKFTFRYCLAIFFCFLFRKLMSSLHLYVCTYTLHYKNMLESIVKKRIRTVEIPEEWKLAVLYPIYIKGDKLNCANYRVIFLLNVTYKVLSTAINRRLLVYRRRRTNTDLLFFVRQMLEKSLEYNVDLNHLFIDFQQAYDSVVWYILMWDLHSLKVQRKVIRNDVEDKKI